MTRSTPSSAGKRCTGAARHDADAVVVAVAEHAAHLFDRVRQHDQHGKLAIGGEPVALEYPQRLRVDDHAFARNDRAEVLCDRHASREDILFRLWHCERHARPVTFTGGSFY
jgi:hypothetical protein